MRKFDEEKNDLLDQIRSLEEENQKYLDKIIKTSKENAQMFEKQRDPGTFVEPSRGMPKSAQNDTHEKMVYMIQKSFQIHKITLIELLPSHDDSTASASTCWTNIG